MMRSKGFRILGVSLGCFFLGLPGHAQLIQSSVGVRSLGSVVGGTAADQVVTGGTTRGNNLFHSFSRFGIATGGSATFDGAGTTGIDNIFGRIEAGPSQMDGSLRLQNWGGNPALILLNPFGFTIGSNFSSVGLTNFSLMAVDALLMEDPASQVFAFDLDLTAAGLGVPNPDWSAATFRGGVAEAGFGTSSYGQGGSTITVNGNLAVPTINMAGSVIDINSGLTADRIGLYAQGFQGSFFTSDPFISTFQAGSFDPARLTFTPFTTAAQVGGVAPSSGFVSSLTQLQNSAGLGNCAGACPAGTIRFQTASSVAGLNTSSPALTLMGRQTVFDSNSLSNASSVTRTAFLGNGLYSSTINFGGNASSQTANEALAELTKASDLLIDLEDLPETISSPLTVAFEVSSFTDEDVEVVALTESGETGSSASSDASGVGRSAGSTESLDRGLSSKVSTSAARALSSPEIQTAFVEAEALIASQVATALGLEGAVSDTLPLTTSDVQLILRQAIKSVRSKGFAAVSVSPRPAEVNRFAFAKTNAQSILQKKAGLPVLSSDSYNPAVLHLRFLDAPDSTQTEADLEMILLTAQGAPQGYRVAVNRERLTTLLRDFYGSLARQQDLNISSPQSSARVLYDLIFGELDLLLRRKKITTLLISADRGLQAVPYGALHDGEHFLGERYGLSLTPSLSLTPLREQFAAGSSVLAFGASKFQDLAPLPLVPEEIEGVTAGRNSLIFLDQEFTPDSLFTMATDPRFGFIHVATHAEFLPGGAQRSVLYTGTSPLPLDQFSRLRDRSSTAILDLISLSACRTAVGDSDSELGFSGLALQAGARSAIGSLWYVDDVATSSFFVQLYRYIKDGIPKAEALQLTRRDFASGLIRLSGDQVVGPEGNVLLRGLDSSQKHLAQIGFDNPYFWAGIQLLGSPW